MDTVAPREITGEVVPAAAAGYPLPAAGLSDAAREAVDAAMPANTRAAYERDLRQFAQWCADHGRSPLPATAETLTEYITWMCYSRPVTDRRGHVIPGRTGVAPATAQRAVAAIRTAHKKARIAPPWAEDAAGVIKGYARRLSDERDPRARPRQAFPMTPEHLAALTGPGLRGKQDLIRMRDTVMFFLDLHGATRASEIVLIDIEDVEDLPQGLDITVRRPKRKRSNQVKIPVEHAPECVRLTREWIQVLAEHGWTSGPLFPRIDKDGNIGASPKPGAPDGRMTPTGAQYRIRLAREAAGLEDQRITFHSGRSGFATRARAAGHDRHDIAWQGDWDPTSTAMDRYIRQVDPWIRSPLRGVGI